MIKRVLLALAALALCISGARADFAFTLGTGATAFSFTASTGGTSLCAASVTHCFASVPINTAGAAFFTAGAPGLVTLTGTNTIATVTNLAQMNGAALLMGNGVTGTGSQRVTISSDNTAFSVNATLSAETTKVIGTVRNVGNVGGVFDAVSGAAVPANLLYNGVNVGGNITPIVGDPCRTVAKTYTPISITTATTTRIVAPAVSKKTYLCYFFVTAASADNVGIVEGTGGTCGTGTAGVIGGSTAANGPNFPANGGMSIGNGGYAVAATAGTNVDLCLITSAATPLAGHIAWVQQ